EEKLRKGTVLRRVASDADRPATPPEKLWSIQATPGLQISASRIDFSQMPCRPNVANRKDQFVRPVQNNVFRCGRQNCKELEPMPAHPQQIPSVGIARNSPPYTRPLAPNRNR